MKKSSCRNQNLLKNSSRNFGCLCLMGLRMKVWKKNNNLNFYKQLAKTFEFSSSLKWYQEYKVLSSNSSNAISFPIITDSHVYVGPSVDLQAHKSESVKLHN